MHIGPIFLIFKQFTPNIRIFLHVYNKGAIAYMFSFQAQTFRCSAQCCEDTSSSMDSVQRCLNNCAAPLENLQRFLQSEIENFEVCHSSLPNCKS